MILKSESRTTRFSKRALKCRLIPTNPLILLSSDIDLHCRFPEKENSQSSIQYLSRSSSEKINLVWKVA